MRLLTSPWWFSLLGGVDLAALAFSVRKLGVARRVAAGDLSAAIELSSVDAAFSFVLPPVDFSQDVKPAGSEPILAAEPGEKMT